MKISETFTATIYLGTRAGYSGEVTSLETVRQWLRTYVDATGLCVTITPTEFIYTKGSEPGVIVGLINYPRFPSSANSIRTKATEIAEGLMALLKQQRVTVVYPDQTVMFEN